MHYKNEINFLFKNSEKKLLFKIFLVILLVSYADNCTIFKTNSKIELNNNGYSNIIVGIEENIKENFNLIENLKYSFTEASKFLYNITKKRVYFKEITILLPSSWSLKNYNDFYDYKITNSTWETYDKADFCIENRDQFTTESPFVVNHATECGSSASYINFSPDFFLNENRTSNLYGPIYKNLIHYWSQFRYGIFPEYPFKTLENENNNEFYLNEKGEIEATRCSFNLTGQIKNPYSFDGKCTQFLPNGLPSDECVFEIDESEQKSASILYKHFLNQVTDFCDNDTQQIDSYHNKLAPTMQNLECNSKSVWEVLREHEDFKDFKNMPFNLDNLVPKFKLVKKVAKKIVLLIDKSIKFNSDKRYHTAEKALNDYIKMMIGDNDLIGIIHFDKYAKIALPLTLVSDNISRKKILESALPRNSEDKKSNIWNGISLGISLLKNPIYPNDKFSPTGGNMILITNSVLDPFYPNRNYLIEQVKKNHITFDLIRFGEEHDNLLESLPIISEGLHFLIKESDSNIDLEDSLTFISTRESKHSDKVIEIFNKIFDSGSVPSTGVIQIDNTISSRTNSVLKMTFQIKNVIDYLQIIVFDPKKYKHESRLHFKCKDSALFESNRYNFEFKNQEIICEFKNPKSGNWTYEILNPYNLVFDFHLKASVFFHDFVDETSYYSNFNDYEESSFSNQLQGEIKVEARWLRLNLAYPNTQAIFVSFSKALKPVLNATVSAIIYRPNGDFIKFKLDDDGKNADRYKNDGVYSKYFSNFNFNGYYYGRVEISTNKFSVVNMQKIVGTPELEHYPSIGILNKINPSSLTLPIDFIQRTISLIPFLLTNYSKNLDLIKPSKIKDLELIEINYDLKEIKLGFTAPGDDADLGRCSKYDIIICLDPNKLIGDISQEDFEFDQDFISTDIITSSSFEFYTNQAGYKEYFIINTTDVIGEVLSIRIRGVDFNNNTGEWSNLLTIKLNKIIKYSSRLRDFNKSTNNWNYSYEYIKSIEAKENFYSIFFIVVLAMLGFVFLIQTILIILLTYEHKIKEKHSCKKKCFVKKNNKDERLIARV